MGKKPTRVTYGGDLAKPIRKVSDEASLLVEWRRRLNLLLEVYSIDEKDSKALEKLALSLATKHVPGLQINLARGPGGRKTQWTAQREAELALAVDALKCNGQASTDKQACEQLLLSGKESRKWGKPLNYRGTREDWLRQLQNRVPKGRKTFIYKMQIGPPGLKMLHEMFGLTDLQLKPDESGSYLGALLKSQIT